MLQQQRYRKGGDPIYVRVSIPRPPPHMPASVLSDFTATASTTFKSGVAGLLQPTRLSGLGEIATHRKQKKALQTGRGWASMGTLEKGRAGKRGDPGGRER